MRQAETGPAPGDYTNMNLQVPNIKPDVYVNSKYKDIKSEGPSPSKYNPNDKVLSTRQRSPDTIIKESVMQMYDVDIPPYKPLQSTKSTKKKGLMKSNS